MPCPACGSLTQLENQLVDPEELRFLRGRNVAAYVIVTMCADCGLIRRFLPPHLLQLLKEQFKTTSKSV